MMIVKTALLVLAVLASIPFWVALRIDRAARTPASRRAMLRTLLFSGGVAVLAIVGGILVNASQFGVHYALPAIPTVWAAAVAFRVLYRAEAAADLAVTVGGDPHAAAGTTITTTSLRALQAAAVVVALSNVATVVVDLTVHTA